MGDSFTFTLISIKCSEFNTSYCFVNNFQTEAQLNLLGYEVALTSLTFYDKFIPDTPPELPPPEPVEPAKEKPFFNIEKGDNKIRVEKLDFITTKVRKTDEDLSSFVSELSKLCTRRNIPVSFTLSVNASKQSTVTVAADLSF